MRCKPGSAKTQRQAEQIYRRDGCMDGSIDFVLDYGKAGL